MAAPAWMRIEWTLMVVSITGVLPAGAMMAESALVGTPTGLQLPASRQRPETAPVHVRATAGRELLVNAVLIASVRPVARAVSVWFVITVLGVSAGKAATP